MADDGKGFWQTMPGVLTGTAAVVGAVATLIVALKPAPTPAGIGPGSLGSNPVSGTGSTGVTIPPPPPPPPRPLMGQLQYGVGYEHNDLNANGWLSVTTPQACSDMCYERADCKAMTYVASNRSCWLKYTVGNRVSVANEVSAVKK